VVTYYLDEADAIANRNPINLPHNSIQLTETIWVRIADLTQTCFEIASFEINVVPIPIAQTPTDYEVCDDTSIGTDSDGLVSGFDLTTKINEVRGNLAASDFDVRFYYSQADADNRNTANEITGPIANTVNPQPIYARIEHNATNECYDTTTFNLVVNELAAIISSDVTLEKCDDDTDGISLFNLTEANSLITASVNQTITYYQTLAEAQGGLVTDQITNYINYPNDVNPASPLNEIFARIENSFGCYRTARIQLVVGVSQIPPTFQTLAYTQCDNANDGDDRNGITTFDFSDAQAQIEALFPGGITVTFYNNQADALAELNAIPDLSNHRNDASPGVQNIYVRVDSNVLNGCLGLGHHVTLTVEALPMANPVTFATECEDDPTDVEISYPFDTTNLESDLLQGQTNVQVDYFDANGNPLTDINNNPITSPFPNTFRTETQTITARVTNSITNTDNNIPCYDETEITFTVDIQPQAFPVTITPLCDDGINQIETTDGMSSFDTTGIQDIILGGQTGMDITYTDANGTVLPTPLPNPFQTATQIVTARVSNPANPSCEAITTLDFVVNPLPQFEVEDDRVVCTNLEQSIVLEVLNPQASDYTYSWTNSLGQEISTQPQVTVSIPDDYMVIATSNQGCPSLPRMINVAESTQPTTTIDDITIVENSSNNSITINNVEGKGYDFALDNEFGPFQDEPFFGNVLAGEHMVYIRSKEGCGTIGIKVFILGFPKFFTPNNDNYNDVWLVKGLGTDYSSASKVSIYDRYGKLLKQMTAKDNAWDGTFNGYRLPSSDYWFVAELVMTSGEIKVYKDHFSLKR
jgi:gliding motility-associated-like protein